MSTTTRSTEKAVPLEWVMSFTPYVYVTVEFILLLHDKPTYIQQFINQSFRNWLVSMWLQNEAYSKQYRDLVATKIIPPHMHIHVHCTVALSGATTLSERYTRDATYWDTVLLRSSPLTVRTTSSSSTPDRGTRSTRSEWQLHCVWGKCEKYACCYSASTCTCRRNDPYRLLS